MSTPVELRVGGQSYRVLASADEGELKRLADVVDARLRSLTAPGRQVSPQALVLAAIALAHDLEQERALRLRAEERAKQALRNVLSRIDSILEEPLSSGTTDAASSHAAAPPDA